MLVSGVALQPDGGESYGAFLERASTAADFSAEDVAVAYATVGGTLCLPSSLVESGRAMRWLVGIDWCRSDPDALDHLASLRRSTVRVPFGSSVVANAECLPSVPFHTKSYLFRGEDALGLATGSANLSRSGLSRGYEHGAFVVVSKPRTRAERAAWANLRRAARWFDSLWQRSDRWVDVRVQYRRRHEHVRTSRSILVTDDDAVGAGAAALRQLSPSDLRVIRASSNLWVEVDYVTPNLGHGRPGNQIDMQAMTRVFFGVPPVVVPRNAALASLVVVYGGAPFDASLRFGNNSMDKINLPIPGAGGPPDYVGQTLLFTRRGDGRGLVYDLRLANPGTKREWSRRSRQAQGLFRMRSGRTWGVF